MTLRYGCRVEIVGMAGTWIYRGPADKPGWVNIQPTGTSNAGLRSLAAATCDTLTIMRRDIVAAPPQPQETII